MSLISLEYSEILDDKIEKKSLEFSQFLLKEPYSLKSLFVTKVDGKSMEPLIDDKALVVADLSQNSFKEKGIFLVYYEDKMWIKKASIIENKQFFVSINPDYTHLVYKKEDVRIVAKVLLTFRSL